MSCKLKSRRATIQHGQGSTPECSEILSFGQTCPSTEANSEALAICRWPARCAENSRGLKSSRLHFVISPDLKLTRLADLSQDCNQEADANMEDKVQNLLMASKQAALWSRRSQQLLLSRVAAASPEAVSSTVAAPEKWYAWAQLPAAAAAAAAAASGASGASTPVGAALPGSRACRRAFAGADCLIGLCWACLEAGADCLWLRRPVISIPSAPADGWMAVHEVPLAATNIQKPQLMNRHGASDGKQLIAIKMLANVLP